jgi:hypothetical protein
MDIRCACSVAHAARPWRRKGTEKPRSRADVQRPLRGRFLSSFNGDVASDSASLSADAPPQTNGRDAGRRKIRACSPDQGRL